jgi:hypothetical protein
VIDDDHALREARPRLFEHVVDRGVIREREVNALSAPGRARRIAAHGRADRGERLGLVRAAVPDLHRLAALAHRAHEARAQ